MICKGRPFAPERRIFDILLLAAEGAKLEVSKIGLMWSDTGAGPSSEAAAAMFDALLQRVAQCCAALVAAQQGAGPTLRQALFAGAKAVTEGCVELVSSPHPFVPYRFSETAALQQLAPFDSMLSVSSPSHAA